MPPKALVIMPSIVVTTLRLEGGNTSIRDNNL